MPPRKRARSAAAASVIAPTVTLTGGQPHHPRLVEKYRAGTLCDVELQSAEGTPFRAHAVCLAASSAYFDALYAGSWADVGERTLKLSGVEAHALSAVIEFIYAGEATVEEASVSAVLEAAAYLQVPEMVEACAGAMTDGLGPETALLTWDVADRQGLAALATSATVAATRHFGAVTASEAWLSAPAERVRALLASDRLAVRSEAEVYNAALAWLRAQSPPVDAEGAAALLSAVRFPLLARDFYQQTVRSEPLLKTAPGMEMLNDAFAAHAFDGNARRRSGFECIYLAGGRYDSDLDNTIDAVERFDPSSNTFETLSPMRTARSGFGMAALGGKIYAVGGNGGDGPLRLAERFCPATNAWEDVAPMSTPRRVHRVVALEGKVYAVGGHNGSAMASVERYCPEANAWETVAPMSTARRAHGVAVLAGKLYAIGGNVGDDAGRSVERYDPSSNSWEAVRKLNTERVAFGVAVLENKIYAVGGISGSTSCKSSVERFDPANNSWETVASMTTSRGRPGVMVVDGMLIAVGGGGECDKPMTSIERFSPASNSWEVIDAALRSPICSFGFASL